MRDQVDGGLAAAMHCGWDGLVESQRESLDDFWAAPTSRSRAIPRCTGDALRALPRPGSAARAEGRAIPAKGLTGRGYNGHSFWDMGATRCRSSRTRPARRRRALLWRHSKLEIAQDRAQRAQRRRRDVPVADDLRPRVLGRLAGRDSAFHINADIADAARRYIAATRTSSSTPRGARAARRVRRLWRSLGHDDAPGKFRIDGAPAPTRARRSPQQRLTNVMGAQHARGGANAARTPRSMPGSSASTRRSRGVARPAATRSSSPSRHRRPRRPPQQSEGFTHHRRWDCRRHHGPKLYPLLLNFPYYLLYSSQVIKQADLVFALDVCADCFSPEQRARDSEYYEAITSADHAVGLRPGDRGEEVGHTDLALLPHRDGVHHLRDLASTRRTAFTSPRWPARGSWPWRARWNADQGRR